MGNDEVAPHSLHFAGECCVLIARGTGCLNGKDVLFQRPENFLIDSEVCTRINPLITWQLKPVKIGAQCNQMEIDVGILLCDQIRIGAQCSLLAGGTIDFHAPESIIPKIEHVFPGNTFGEFTALSPVGARSRPDDERAE